MPPVTGSSLPQETALNTRVSIPAVEPKSALWLPLFSPCLGHGTRGSAVLQGGGKLPWEVGVPSAAPLCRPATALSAHPLLCRDAGGSAGSGPRDPSGPPCVPTEAPQAQEAEAQGAQKPAWEHNCHEGGGHGIGTLHHGDGLVMGWEPSVLGQPPAERPRPARAPLSLGAPL